MLLLVWLEEEDEDDNNGKMTGTAANSTDWLFSFPNASLPLRWPQFDVFWVA
jgi:hypothetical protein